MTSAMRSMWFRPARGLALLAAAIQLSAPLAAHGHGGGGGHMGGFGGGGHMGGYGGGGHMGGYGGGYGGAREMSGGFSGGRDMGARDMGARDMGARDFGPQEFGGRDFAGDRGAEGVRRLDGGGALDGGGRLDGGRAGEGVRDFGPGHFAGDGHVSRADFQQIANRGVGGAGVGRGAVRPYSATNLAERGTAIRNNFYNNGWYGGRGWYANHFNPWWPGGWWGGWWGRTGPIGRDSQSSNSPSNIRNRQRHAGRRWDCPRQHRQRAIRQRTVLQMLSRTAQDQPSQLLLV